ncbi:unnamed protein product [Cunninghamella blakesleeana]
MPYNTNNKNRPPALWILGGFVCGMLTMTLFSTMTAHSTVSTDHGSMLKKRDVQEKLSTNSQSILQFGDPGDARDFLERESYVVSYNRRDCVASWVGEHLTAKSLIAGEGVNRDKSKFKEDPDVPPQFRSTLADYSGSGFDRGHMAPAGDAVTTQTAMDQTFYLSNMSPQVGIGFNRQYWAYLEGFVRSLTKTFSDVYVFTGPLFLPQKDSDGSYTTTFKVLKGNVAVPTHFYKIILVPQKDAQDKYAYGAFILPNQAIDSKTDLTSFKVDKAVVEKASGLTFFDKLDASTLADLCTLTKCATTNYGGSD